MTVRTHTLLKTRLIVSAFVALIAFPSAGPAAAQNAPQSSGFVDHWVGIYQPVTHGPDLGLSSLFDLSDGTWLAVPIYPVSALPGNPEVPVGAAYVNFFAGLTLCVERLPGGALGMVFTNMTFTVIPDPATGGFYLNGTADLAIVEGTGIYQAFVGGTDHMVFNTHFINALTVDEDCYCYVSPP